MLRHSRLHNRNQRERWIAKRRRLFARWVGDTDHGRQRPPRPLEVREAEYWTSRRLGMLSKWNGACGCLMCRVRYSRAVTKRETERIKEVA